MTEFSIETSLSSPDIISDALEKRNISCKVIGMRFLNDYGQEIAESDIDNDSGDPAKMMSGAIIDIESDTDETTLDDILQEVADYEGINLAIV